MHSAIDSGHMEAVRLLVEAGANCNKRNEAGFTSLHRSAYKVEGPQFLSLKELT